ncbi:MAG: hypothetical protein ACHQDE_01925 [Acidimicrobiia bacterium]
MSKRILLVVCALLVVLAGCKVDATVSIRVHRDGSGVVTVTANLDPEAVKAAETGGGKLEDRVRLADLGRAGWTVEPWARGKDGSAQIVLRKPFQSPTQVAGIMREVSGASGPLRDVTVTRDRGLLSTHYEVKGSLDLAQLQTGVAADPDVVAALTNQKVDVNAIDQSLLAQIRDSFGLTVTVQLPGRDTQVVGTAGKARRIDASTSVLDTKRVGLILGAIVLVVLAILVLFWPGRRARRRA